MSEQSATPQPAETAIPSEAGSESLSSPQSVAIYGLGYIGLPTAAFFASTGLQVVGVDINAAAVDAVNAGTLPFVEPGMDTLLARVVADGSLRATTEPVAADVHIVAVPTPFAEDHAVDDRYVMSAAASVASVAKPGDLVILESTSPPGLTERMVARIVELRPDLTTELGQPGTIFAAHAPERVLPGKIMEEMVSNDRIVGGINEVSSRLAQSLYKRFCAGEVVITDARTAELTKLVENSFRDVNIAFANELSMICDELRIDVWELIRLANRHPRVNILQPGPGVGGHCIAVDPWFIVSAAPAQARLIAMARQVNDAKPDWVVAQVCDAVASLPEERQAAPVIAALGLSFKADIDDLRESPAVTVAGAVADTFLDGQILAVEHHVDALPAALANRRNVSLVPFQEALSRADVVVILVDHHDFKLKRAAIEAHPLVINTRG